MNDSPCRSASLATKLKGSASHKARNHSGQSHLTFRAPDMPPRPRIPLADHPLHIVQRGINREPCFFADEDYQCYLHWLEEAARDCRSAIHAYVLMTNHVHLLLTPATPGAPARLMQSLGRRYVQYANRQYRRTGSLWEGRYKSSVVHGKLSAGLHALHRTQPGTRRHGERPGALSMVELPAQRLGASRRTTHTPRFVSRPGYLGRGTVGELSGAVPIRTRR